MARPASRLDAALAAGLLLGGLGGAAIPSTVPTFPSRGATAPTCALILSTNDTHGHLLPAKPSWAHGREVGGAAALAGWLGRERRGSACPAFLFSAGDLMQGTAISNLLAGRPVIEVFDAMGYDAAAVGNHEFDWGLDTLWARMAEARFPFLAANVYLKGSGRHPEWVRPWTIIDRGGVRVGVVGVTTRSTPWTTRPSVVADLEFRNLAEAIDRSVPEVRARGADFVVVLLHAGGFCSRGERECRGEAIDALRATRSRWDYAITGHTHSLIRTRIRGRPVVQSWSNGLAFGEERLTRVGRDSVSAQLPAVRTPWTDGAEPDARVAALVDRSRTEVEARASAPVARLAAPLRRAGRGVEYGLGDLVADAQRAATGTQVAIMNSGGIRASLPAGPVSYGDLLEVQPFGNTLVRLEVTGASLRRALDQALEADGPHAHLSGLRACYDPAVGASGRVLGLVLEDGTPVAPRATYTLTVNDFMADGGAGFSSLASPIESTPTGITDLEALVSYLRGRPQPVTAPAPDRWVRAVGPPGRAAAREDPGGAGGADPCAAVAAEAGP